MSKQTRYFHIRSFATGGPGGAAVKVIGDPERVSQVSVQAAFCSPDDMYCKAIGRAQASKSPIKIVPLRYLPAELGRIEAKVNKKCGAGQVHIHDYSYAIKYFLPKE